MDTQLANQKEQEMLKTMQVATKKIVDERIQRNGEM